MTKKAKEEPVAETIRIPSDEVGRWHTGRDMQIQLGITQDSIYLTRAGWENVDNVGVVWKHDTHYPGGDCMANVAVEIQHRIDTGYVDALASVTKFVDDLHRNPTPKESPA